MVVLCGTMLLVWDALLVFNVGILGEFARASANPNLRGPLLVAGILALMLGVGILRARPYRPDLGDAAYLVDPLGVKVQQALPRSWWTGDSKPSSRAANNREFAYRFGPRRER